MDFDEKLYKSWLYSQIVRDGKLFKTQKTKRELSTQSLIGIILKTNPKLAKKLFRNTIDLNGDIPKDELMSFLSHTKKGEIIRWTNSKGQKMFFINAGRNKLKKTKKIIPLGENLDFYEFKKLKKTFLRDFINHDLEKMRKFIQLEKERKVSLLKQLFIKKKYQLPIPDNFEGNMIKAIREGVEPVVAAKQLILAMTEKEKNQMSNIFFDKGIRNNSDMLQYFGKLKDKALNTVRTIEKTERIIQKKFLKIEKNIER